MNNNKDYSKLLTHLYQKYTEQSPNSQSVHIQAKKYLIDGGSHSLRLTEPFPLRISKANGAWITDIDNHKILDFWQGHFANILGHNPSIITQELINQLSNSFGLLTGIADELQYETAKTLCQMTDTERTRFTTSGTLATMYAIFLAKAYTKRTLVMKAGGGWHGAQPWSLKGLSFSNTQNTGYENIDSAGTPASLSDEVIITQYNNIENLKNQFRKFSNQIACFIVEPIMGAGGFLPAEKEYLQTARELCDHYGAVLIFDEVVSGFRFKAGSAGSLYKISPDLSIFGKIIGGGMPIAAVAGKYDILQLAENYYPQNVKFSGGTFSAHPMCLMAANTTMKHLEKNQNDIYPYLGKLGEKLREIITNTFRKAGFNVWISGSNDIIRQSSFAAIHFPYKDNTKITSPDIVNNADICDIELRTKILPLAFLTENIHMVKSHGALSTEHNLDDLIILETACYNIIKSIKQFSP